MAKSRYSPTHGELVLQAGKWLQKRAVVPVRDYKDRTGRHRRVKCHVVLLEHGSGCPEIPDALGWGPANFSILVECKTSRSDFRADAKKAWRTRPERGVGYYRYFLAPQGMIGVDEVPEKWGLLEATSPKVIKVLKLPQAHPQYNLRSEVAMLVSEVRLRDLAVSGAELYPSARADRILTALDGFARKRFPNGERGGVQTPELPRSG